MNKSDSDSIIIQQKDHPQNQLNKINHPVYSSNVRSLNPKENGLDRPTTKQQKTVAYIYSEQALVYFREGNWQEAIAACQKALQISPESAEAYKTLGNILQRLGKKGKALGYYAKALEIKPDLAEVYANLGSFYAEQEKWEQAINYYHQALTLKPNLAGIYRSLALIWEELGKDQQALECLSQAVHLEPKTLAPEDYFVFGNQLYEQQKFREASIFYIQGVKLNPLATTELARLVDILEKIGEWQSAAEYYRQLITLKTATTDDRAAAVINKPIKRLLSRSAKALPPSPKNSKAPLLSEAKSTKPKKQLPANNGVNGQSATKQLTGSQQPSSSLEAQPESATSWNNLGSLYAKKQQWEKAIGCYQEAIQLDSGSSKTYRNLARVYAKTEQKEKATDCWYEAFSLEPNSVSPQDHFDLGKSLWQQNKIDRAIACFRRTIQLKPEFGHAYLSLGEIFHSQKRIEESKSCYLQAIKYSPHDFQAYFRLAQIATEQENWQQAREYYQKTVALEANHWEAYYNLAEALSKEKKWSEATDAYRQAISLKEDFSWAHHNLAYALQQEEKWSEAADAYRQAISLKEDFFWSHYNLGDTLSKLFQWDEAIAAYRRTTELQPDCAEAYAHWGDALVRQEKWDEAVVCYRKAIEINPANQLCVYQNLGEALIRQKLVDKHETSDSVINTAHDIEETDSIETAHQAIVANPQDYQGYLKLGDALIEQKKLKEGMVFYQIAKQIKPNDFGIDLKINDLLEQL